MREVYPFTRNANYKNQKKLLNILNDQLKDNGFLIFEQIKNKNDLFDNLRRMKIRHRVFPLLPVRFGDKKHLNLMFFKSKILQFILRIIYKIFYKKINFLILLYKFKKK